MNHGFTCENGRYWKRPKGKRYKWTSELPLEFNGKCGYYESEAYNYYMNRYNNLCWRCEEVLSYNNNIDRLQLNVEDEIDFDRTSTPTPPEIIKNIYKEGFYNFANFPLDHYNRMIIPDEIYEYYVEKMKKEEENKIFTMTGKTSYKITYPNPLSLLELAFKKVIESGSLEPKYTSILPYHLQERYKLESFRHYLCDV